MAKRNASTNLNHDNWNDDDEPEESGTFTRAPDDVIKTRVIKTARRRNIMSGTENENQPAAKSIFSSFSGFSKTAAPASIAPTFSFLSKNSFAQKSPEESETKANAAPALSNSIMMSNSLPSNTNSSDSDKNEYLSKLRGLNEGVSQWIQKHVKANPLCNLTPIFQDYERYFKEIENSNKSNKITNSKTTVAVVDDKPIQKSSTTNIFSSTASPNVNPFNNSFAKPENGKDAPSTFTFGTKPAATTFTFGSATTKPVLSNSSSSTAAFSFGGDSAKPFQFSNVASNSGDANKTKPTTIDKEDEDEPPKVEFVPVVEEGNVFSKRCKVFVKKDGGFAEKGVGQLFLKPIPDKDKYQLIVRANTSIGNLLLNIVLSDSIPTQRMGKNNVMLVCIPMPDDKEPCSVLLRVKTAGEADELLVVLNKHKK